MNFSIDNIELVGLWSIKNTEGNINCCICGSTIMMPQNKQDKNTNIKNNGHVRKNKYGQHNNMIQLFKCGHALHLECSGYLSYQCRVPLCHSNAYCIVSPNVIRDVNLRQHINTDVLKLCKTDS